MKWTNLKSVCCPKCGETLQETESGYRCSELVHPNGCATQLGCDFKISKEKFNEVVNNLYNKKPHHAPEDYLSALNNFGHKEYSQDYSDEIDRLAD